MSIINSKRERKYPGKLCFELWAELGTLEKAGAELKRRGYTTSSGKQPSPMSVRANAMLWVSENLEEAYPMYLSKGSQLLEYDEFLYWVVPYIKRLLSKPNARRYVKWLRKNKLESYDPDYADKNLSLDEWEAEVANLRTHLKSS